MHPIKEETAKGAINLTATSHTCLKQGSMRSISHEWKRLSYLIVDYFTSYPVVSLLTETTSSAIIEHTKSIFARHGIPNTVITDNGPQFTSKEYRDFARQ